jgi:tetratricopeptide (TPR) repeat protein
MDSDQANDELSNASDDGDLVSELEETIIEMTGRLSSDDKDVAALIYRGEAYFDLGETEKAGADLEQALKIEDKCASTHFSWARYQLDLGNGEVVLKHIQRAIEIDTINPGHEVDVKTGYADDSRALAQYMLAEALMEQDRNFDALKAIERAITLDDQSSEFFILRSELKKNAGEFEASLADLDTAAQLDPENVEIRVDRALTLLDNGMEEKALEEIELAFKIAEEDGSARAELFAIRGTAYANQGDVLRAREDFRRAIEFDDNNFDAHMGLSDLAIRTRDFEVAEKHLDRAEDIDPKEPAVYLNRGVLEKQRKKNSKALVALDQAISLDSDYAEAYHLRGQVRQELGDAEHSKDFEKAKDLGFEIEA